MRVFLAAVRVIRFMKIEAKSIVFINYCIYEFKKKRFNTSVEN